jgi:hypothetical protein
VKKSKNRSSQEAKASATNVGNTWGTWQDRQQPQQLRCRFGNDWLPKQNVQVYADLFGIVFK